MERGQLSITPDTKISELLKNYPQLESVLIKFSPTFSALKNPVLRRTVAKVTSLQQAAKVGNVSVVDMVDKLRSVVGQPPLSEEIEMGENSEYSPEFTPDKITHHFDARPIIEAGDHPKDAILDLANTMKTDECIEILTPFPPVPIADLLRKKGFSVTMLQPKGGVVKTYVSR
ncbi:MAG: DUF1858 domain-containing protein [Porphyromonadaceae bacterium]|nr:DUF1858 domain-containing protein [Porphyromonadaceae bacterium]